MGAKKVPRRTHLIEVDDVDDPVAEVGCGGRLCLHHGVREVWLQQQRLHALHDLLQPTPWMSSREQTSSYSGRNRSLAVVLPASGLYSYGTTVVVVVVGEALAFDEIDSLGCG